jgi:protein tyrosine phosphatase (PTP) superfamily phosphohydrolase (DUF442 family)
MRNRAFHAVGLLGCAAFLCAPTRGDDPSPARGPERIAIGSIENTFRLSPRLYSGGDPQGERALRALKELGVRTIVSVDGAPPDVEAARGLGLRYVHLPIGYDGVPREQAVRLVRAIATLPGAVYVHCHHGKHRGPAAAAICGMASEGWTNEQAVDWMKQAGTSPDFRGLFESARAFVAPTADELMRMGDDLPERVEPPDLVEAMVELDGLWDRLKLARKSAFGPTPDRPRSAATDDAIQVVELFREAARLDESRRRGDEFLKALSDAERRAVELHAALKAIEDAPSPRPLGMVDASMAAVEKGCASCHARSRNNRPSAAK